MPLVTVPVRPSGEPMATTGSPVAERLVEAWPDCLERFTAVVPRDYKAVVKQTNTNGNGTANGNISAPADVSPNRSVLPSISVPQNLSVPQSPSVPRNSESFNPPVGDGAHAATKRGRASLATSGSSLTAQSGDAGPINGETTEAKTEEQASHA